MKYTYFVSYSGVKTTPINVFGFGPSAWKFGNQQIEIGIKINSMEAVKNIETMLSKTLKFDEVVLMGFSLFKEEPV